MSNKTAKFIAAITNPLTKHNFLVRTPLLEGVDVLVQATAFPSEKLRVLTLYYQGEPIRFPATPENEGTWSCQIPESETAIVFKKMAAEKGLIWKQKDGVLFPGNKTVIEVVARGLKDKELFSVKLHGSFILTRGNVDLSNQEAATGWIWNVTFSYDWIEDVEK